jgi:hypothetical protein
MARKSRAAHEQSVRQLSLRIMAKENQHFIPQGYLRNFTIPGEKSLVWEYDKKSGKISDQPKSVRKICAIRYYYAQEDQDGNLDTDRLEDVFGKMIEDPALRVIRKIPSRPYSDFELNTDEMTALVMFISLLSTRGPSFRGGVEEVYRLGVQAVGERVIGEQLERGEVPEVLRRKIEEQGLWNAIQVQIKNWASLLPMLQVAAFGADSLLGKQWPFVLTEGNNSFLTADNPFVFTPFQRSTGLQLIGPFHPESYVTVPLRKDLALVMYPSDCLSDGHFQTSSFTPKQTKSLNRRTIAAALRFIYSHERNERILKTVIELRDRSQAFRVR